MTDLKIIEECRKGNLDSFRKLIDQTSPFAYSVAFRLLGDDDLAKDVVQDAMIVIWQKINRIKTAEVYKTWIYRIVVNKCYDQLRKRKRNPEYYADDRTWSLIADRTVDNTSTGLENDEIALVISLLTEQLSPQQKTVFVLSELEQLSADEISEISGMTRTKIKANLYYARRKISELLEKYL
ncbi:MAG TPA: RNA polymerase sigma factor [Bacteroidales bacterium]|nr:RNA polymerase sigma factor [Bacteroidales bacterium]